MPTILVEANQNICPDNRMSKQTKFEPKWLLWQNNVKAKPNSNKHTQIKWFEQTQKYLN